jgi:hypothetical protein
MDSMDLIALLVLILAQLIGLAMIYYGYRQISTASRSRDWPTTQGLVEASYVSEEKDDDLNRAYKVTVRYRYSVLFENYSGNSPTAGSLSFSAREEAEQFVERYPEEARVKVYYDRHNPSVSVLEPGTQRGGFTLVFAGFLFSGLSALFLWLILSEG